jgi:glutaredoxin 3
MKFVEYKLGRDFDKDQFYDVFGQGSTFPQVLKDQEKLGGCMDTVKYLRENKLV